MWAGLRKRGQKFPTSLKLALPGIHPYNYAGLNPIKNKDAFGLFFSPEISDSPEGEPVRTLDEFLRHVSGRSLEEVINEQGPPKYASQPWGPDEDFRYVRLPDSNVVVDMRHFLIVGQKGNIVGLFGELFQLTGKKSRESAFDLQDLISNNLGAQFFRQRDPNSSLAVQLDHFFRKRIREDVVRTCQMRPR